MTGIADDLLIRPIAAGEMEPLLRVVESAFGEEAAPEAIAAWSQVMEPARTFAVVDGEAIVGGGSVFSMRLSIPGGVLEAGGLTAVGMLPSHRRRGALRRLMARALEDGRERREPLSVLWASEAAIYQRFGYGMAAMRGTIVVPRGQVRFAPPLEGPGPVRLLSGEAAMAVLPAIWDRAASLTPGFFARSESWWRHEVLDDAKWRRDGAGPRFVAVQEIDGRPEGYCFYRIRSDGDHLGPRDTLELRELVAPSPSAELGLWRFVFDMDLVATVRAWNVALDTPLLLRVAEPRRLGLTLTDGLWLRVLDLPAALAARAYPLDDHVVLEVSDDLVPSNTGRWRLDTRGDAADISVTDDPADLALGISELSAVYLGGVRPSDLLRAGRIRESTPGSAARLDHLFAPGRRPWCPAVF